MAADLGWASPGQESRYADDFESDEDPAASLASPACSSPSPGRGSPGPHSTVPQVGDPPCRLRQVELFAPSEPGRAYVAGLPTGRLDPDAFRDGRSARQDADASLKRLDPASQEAIAWLRSGGLRRSGGPDAALTHAEQVSKKRAAQSAAVADLHADTLLKIALLSLVAEPTGRPRLCLDDAAQYARTWPDAPLATRAEASQSARIHQSARVHRAAESAADSALDLLEALPGPRASASLNHKVGVRATRAKKAQRPASAAAHPSPKVQGRTATAAVAAAASATASAAATSAFETCYGRLVQHVMRFGDDELASPERPGGGPSDQELLATTIKELLLDVEIAMNIKTRFIALRKQRRKHHG
mmetsp:Transcript_22945/g.65158  ORF Transcript_22945/g.65158 Transcript_22945/m.65158 type:complete len:360 (+) Transcript_22945:193-1272(+)